MPTEEAPDFDKPAIADGFARYAAAKAEWDIARAQAEVVRAAMRRGDEIDPRDALAVLAAEERPAPVIEDAAEGAFREEVRRLARWYRNVHAGGCRQSHTVGELDLVDVLQRQCAKFERSTFVRRVDAWGTVPPAERATALVALREEARRWAAELAGVVEQIFDEYENQDRGHDIQEVAQ